MQANNILYSLCSNANWFEVRQFLSSNIILSKSSNCLMIHLLSSVMYCTSEGSCLHQACCRDAPDHIVMALLDIGGKELVMRRNDCDQVALQYACWFGASYNVVKMLIDVGGKDLVMAKDTYGNTAMHNVRHHSIKDHTRVADKIKLLLQVGDADLLLVTRRNDGKTPLQFATEEGASDEIRNLLTPQSYSNLNSTENNMSSSSISPGDIRNTHSIKQRSNQNHHATYPIQSSTNIEDASLKEAKEYAQKIQQDLDQKCEDYSALEKQKLDIEKEVENQRAKYAFMFEQKDRCEIEYRDRIQALTELCSKQRAAVKKMKDAKSGLDTGNNSTTPSHITAALGTLKALVDNNFECSICLDTYTDPHVVPECLHRFCGACIKESIRQCGPECPSCRARLTTKRGLRKDNELLEMMTKVLEVVDHLEQSSQTSMRGVKNENQMKYTERACSSQEHQTTPHQSPTGTHRAHNNIHRLQTQQVNESHEQTTKIQQCYSQKCRKGNDVAEGKESEQSNAKIRDLENELEIQRAKNAALLGQKQNNLKYYSDWKDRMQKANQICLEHKTKLQELEHVKRKHSGEEKEQESDSVVDSSRSSSGPKRSKKRGSDSTISSTNDVQGREDRYDGSDGERTEA